MGLILEAREARVLRAGAELALTARNGDLLFAGDSVSIEGGAMRLLFCPEKVDLMFQAPAEVAVRERALRIRADRSPVRKSADNCLLPTLDRVAASQQHYGESLIRALEPPGTTDSPGPSRVEALPDAERTALRRELEPIDQALAADPKDAAARVARLAVLEKYRLSAELLVEYKKLADEWPEAAWVRSRLFVHQKTQVQSRPAVRPAAGAGKTYALLVGISKYQRIPERQWLEDAHEDAMLFADYLRSPRGGALAAPDLVLLTDEKATTAAVKNAFETFLKVRAGRSDTVVIFIAAHGVVEQQRRNAYIVTYDSDPEDFAATALPMADIQTLVREDLSRVGHVLVYVDVCRAGNIGALRGNNPVNQAMERLTEADGDLFLFLASGPNEVSIEGPQFGGGHGAFSYFLMDAFNGSSDVDGDGVVTVGEVIEYVREKVIEATSRRQHPRDLGSIEHGVTLAEMGLPGVTIPAFSSPKQPATVLAAKPPAQRSLNGPGSTGQTAAEAAQEGELDLVIAAGRILPDEPQGAFTVLGRLRRLLTPEQYLIEQNKLRVALENAGQQVLLRYLAGDEHPQDRNAFLRGAAYFRAAQGLTPESLFLESRAAFCSGRAALFAKEYGRANGLLEQAARIDPNGAYSYNALGIGYLEQAEYTRAIQAFRDAARLAPRWAYPLHNLALAYTQTGDYSAAIQSYLRAGGLAPQYSYLPYNLGLVYQRLNRRKEARAAFEKAMALAPGSGEPYNALGYLQASYGRDAQAERLYRQALERNADLLAARQNLAVLLSAKPDRFREAVDLWRQNLAKSPDYIASRLSLARALVRQGDYAQAIPEYEELVRQKPQYAAAHLALADLYAGQSQPAAALHQLEEAAKLEPRSAEIHEKIGDLEKSRGRSAEAFAAYREALKYADDAGMRRRLGRKMK